MSIKVKRYERNKNKTVSWQSLENILVRNAMKSNGLFRIITTWNNSGSVGVAIKKNGKLVGYPLRSLKGASVLPRAYKNNEHS